MPKKNSAYDKTKRESHESLEALLKLISTSPRTELPALENVNSEHKTSQWPLPTTGQGATEQTVESEHLEQFCRDYVDVRSFSDHANHKYFHNIFTALVKQRLANLQWTSQASPESILCVLKCLRILLRDPTYQVEFYSLNGVKVLTEHLCKATDSYTSHGDAPFVIDILKEMTNIFQKLSAVEKHKSSLVKYKVHEPLVLLMDAPDIVVVHCTLHALISLAESDKLKALIAEMCYSIEILLRIMQNYDNLSKKLAASLLRSLCSNPRTRECVKVYDGIPILLSQLHTDTGCRLLWHIVWCLVQLSEDEEVSNDIRQMGGIPFLLALLHESRFVPDRVATGAALKTPSVEEAEELIDHTLQLKSALCACITELVRTDTNAQQVVQANGVYTIALLLLPQACAEKDKRYQKSASQLQASAFRTLRFLFSLERNRRLFKLLFPPAMFARFIDVGHYRSQPKAYMSLVKDINAFSEEDLHKLKTNIDQLNINKAPSQTIAEYHVFDLLGRGAFGSVFKVKKSSGRRSVDHYYAMKEVQVSSVSFGKSVKEQQESVGDVMNELSIIRERLNHPNIVKYIETFQENDKLYIVMELIQGVPLGEHFNSLKEKESHFSESRIWSIFIQLVLALRYLHKEKQILHRDLTPNNIMLGEHDHVTITDFGLAKQKQQECSNLTSVVGTILYWCPELIQNRPYNEKADVWALGCILYQMCTLQPPFFSNSMYSLVTRIVEATYNPIRPYDASTGKGYSEEVITTIRKCITTDVKERPDIVGVASSIADQIIVHYEHQRKVHAVVEKKLEKERKRTQRYFNENHDNMQKYHKLRNLSKERYEELANLESSGGAVAMKEVNVSPGAYSSSSDKEICSDSSPASNFSFQSPMTASMLMDASHLHDNGYWEAPRPSRPFYQQSDESEADVESLSSESESRESSAGSTRSHRQLLKQPVDQRIQQRPIRNPDTHSQPLLLEIAGNSRDSGIYSADPSPNHNPKSHDPGGRSPPAEGQEVNVTRIQRSMSTPAAHVALRATSGGKPRPSSAKTATLTISANKVREVSDPILQMLHQLHKIIFISQLPPTLCHNPNRRVIERFKRALFTPGSTSSNLKNELQKLSKMSREQIDLNLGHGESQHLLRQVQQEQDHRMGEGGIVVYENSEDGIITYQLLHSMIETLLKDSGYYSIPLPTQSIRQLGTLFVTHE